MNKVILMGRLVRDVELRQTPNGISVASFTIAVDRNYVPKDGQRQTDFISCVAWRQTAEFIARYFGKGRMIAVVGSIQTRSWDGQDGQKRYATEVVVDEAHFTGSKAESGGSASGSSYSGGQFQNGAPAGGFGGGSGFGGSGFGSQQNGGYQPPAQSSNDPFGDFDDGGFADIDGSEDDLPF